MTNDGFHAYKYDAEGNIVSVDSGSTASYSYDALNHRGRSIVGSTVDEFVYNAAGQRATIWNGNTKTVIQGQYYWGGKRVAYYNGGSLHFQHQDWMGTEHIRSSYNGGGDGQFTSLPFGDDLTTTGGTDTDAYHFAQIDHDYETDTEHAQFRQYSSAQGRFLSPDPYGGSYDPSNPQSFNRYAYVASNPLSAADPLGLNPCVPVSINTGSGGGGGMSPFCHAANYGTGDGVGMQLLSDINATSAMYNGPTSYVAPDGTTFILQGTDGNGNPVWILPGKNGEPSISVPIGSPLAEQDGLPSSVPFAMGAIDPAGPQQESSNNAPSTATQIKAGAIAAKVIAYNLFVPTCQSLANSSATLGRISGATGAYAVGSAVLAAETGGITLPGAAVLGTISAATGLVSFGYDLAANFQIGCR